MKTNRRRFVLGSFAALGALALPRRPRLRWPRSSDKLRIGFVGVGGRGRANLNALSNEAVVALCDVDARHLEKARREVAPKAAVFADFREMIDTVDDLDAVAVSTPDHTHAAVAAYALRRGLHVYCEKPLAHAVWEARVLANLARERGLVTQMGTQIHATSNYRRVVELVQTGAIGAVKEVHVFCEKDWGGGKRPVETPSVPAWMSWDLWIGPAGMRPWHPTYHPANWRRFWAFGGGTLADMACHYMDLAHWACDLRGPVSVETKGPAADPESPPHALEVRYEHPPRAGRPGLFVTWYDGGRRPLDLLKARGLEGWKNGLLFLGEKGWLAADYGRHVLGPKAAFKDFQPPTPFIPDSIGHHAEWAQACKTGGPTTCNFSYSGALSETVLLGIVAHRRGRKLLWDAATCRVTNDEEARALIRPAYREGWTL
ncbi:MAG TPA: Gfo/Idh/MocA family oxidoreductase [Planctomycetes bacterium]|nr:Gfo/Idh/MocA family oxidoreductase [Planctomycetota bacterium]